MKITFNSIEHYPDGYCMCGISFRQFIKRLFKKQFELFVELPRGGTLWIYPYFRFRYERPSYIEFPPEDIMTEIKD